MLAGELITQMEAAKLAGMSHTTIRNWLRRRLLTPYRRAIDGRVMIDREELMQKLSAERIEPDDKK